MAVTRPQTVAEMQASKKVKQLDYDVRVENISKQLIKVHLRAPASLDFFSGAHDVSLMPGKQVTLKKKRLWMEQIDRLCKQRKLRKVFDTENNSNPK